MRDIGGSDDHGEQVRSGRGVKSSNRPASPFWDLRLSPASRFHHRHSRPEQASPDRRRSRDHSRHSSTELVRRQPDAEELILRYRESTLRNTEPGNDRPSRHSRARDAPTSSPSTKRHRDLSHPPESAHRKRSEKPYSPSRHERGYSRDSDSRKRRRLSPHEPSHRRPPHSHRSPRRSEDTRPQHKRSYSRSPTRNDLIRRHTASRASKYGPPPPLSQSPSPGPERLREHNRRQRAPSARSSRPSQSYGAASQDYPGADPDRRPLHRQAPPRSPQPYRDQRRRDQSPNAHFTSHPDLDDDMTSRSSYRAGNKALYAHKPYYGNEPRSSDAQGYSQSPQRGGGSYQNSPSMSPYGAYRAGLTGQYSPQQQYPPPYHHGHGSHGASNAPPEYFHSHYARSPPNSAPSGPAQPYSKGGYREPYRGNSHRGGSFSGRGGYRGSGPQTSQWPPTKPASSLPRGHDLPPDHANRYQNAVGASDDAKRQADAASAAAEQNRGDLSKASAVVASQPEQHLEVAAPSSAQPTVPDSAPSQPGSSGKFSFSFKASSKPTPTAPKLEISQKFNAIPQRRDSEHKASRDRAPPSSAPTAPASARPRPDPEKAFGGPKSAPRTRKVKKTLKRLKARPTLPSDLAASESVFFRKPGNESVVGSGTYGKVFKGLNVYTKGLVALKRIRMEGERDGFPVTAVREIKLLQSLRHTNIVNLEEVMVEKNDCFMVFEYLSHDLTGLLNHPTFKLDPAQRKHLAKQLFEGLDYLHTRGVLHRDIKAANILVSSDGVLKLADFGLARFYAKRHQLDYTNRVITIWYRSPELLLGETQYTAAVDVWSAACVMVEIFTRQAIFTGDGTELSQLDKIYNILGTPNRKDWPGLMDMAWFELLRPTAKRRSVFAEKYQDKVTPAAFDLLLSIFQYDPAKRPTAAEALQHGYFTTEEPQPRQAVELANIDGEWHEFESKALRKENERREREARRAAKDASRESDKKRGPESQSRDRETKRVHVD